MTVGDVISGLGLIVAILALLQGWVANRGVVEGKVDLAERTADLRVAQERSAATLEERVSNIQEDVRELKKNNSKPNE